MREGLTALRLGLAGWPAERGTASRRARHRARRGDGRSAPRHASLDRWGPGRHSVGAVARGGGHLRRHPAPPGDDRRLGGGLAALCLGRSPDEPLDRAAPTTARAGSTRRSRRARTRWRCWRASATAPSTRSPPTTRRTRPSGKLVPFDDAAPGLIGLETALSLGLAAVESGRLELAPGGRALHPTSRRSSVRRARWT